MSDGVMILSVSTGIHEDPFPDQDSGNRFPSDHWLLGNSAAAVVAVVVLLVVPSLGRDTVVATSLPLPLTAVCWDQRSRLRSRS